MYVVIFRAKVKQFDADYSETAAMLRDTALKDFGCTEFHAVTEGDQEVALSYWPDQDSIRRWKAHADHLVAQRKGRERWYESITVQVAKIERAYSRP